MTTLKAGDVTKVSDFYQEHDVTTGYTYSVNSHTEKPGPLLPVNVPRTILQSDLMHLNFFRP